MENGNTRLQVNRPRLAPKGAKTYSSPVVTVFGDVVALTKNMACGGNDGPAGQFLS